MIPMHASHLLLGKPCQFDRKNKRDELKNRYFLENDGRT